MLEDEQKDNALQRLSRINGQVGGVQRMVEDDRYCIDVLHQIAAVRAALAKVSTMVLDAHLRTCVQQAFAEEDSEKREEKITEIIRIFERHSRS